MKNTKKQVGSFAIAKLQAKRRSLLAIIAIVAIIGCMAVSCGGGGGSPSSVVKQFYTAAEKGDEKALRNLMTEEAGMWVELLLSADVEKTMKPAIAKTTEKIDGNKATVTATLKDGKTEEVKLVKVDGKWKITF